MTSQTAHATPSQILGHLKLAQSLDAPVAAAPSPAATLAGHVIELSGRLGTRSRACANKRSCSGSSSLNRQCGQEGSSGIKSRCLQRVRTWLSGKTIWEGGWVGRDDVARDHGNVEKRERGRENGERKRAEVRSIVATNSNHLGIPHRPGEQQWQFLPRLAKKAFQST